MNQYRPNGFSQFPPVVKNLIIINILIFCATYVLQKANIIDLEFFGALYYWGSPLFHFWQPVTNLFLHSNVGHLFSHMFSLWVFGGVLENIFGTKRFLLFYFICGIGGSLCYEIVFFLEHFRDIQWFSQLSQLDRTAVVNQIITTGSGYQKAFPMFYNAMGASGATIGLYFAFGYLFPNEQMSFWGFPMKAKILVTIFGLIEISAGIQNDPMSNIAYFAHIGGALFAFLLLRYWQKKQTNNRYR